MGIKIDFLFREILDTPAKRSRGRPPKSDSGVRVEFNIPTEQAAYLLAVGRRFGWGTEINEVVRAILVAELIALQKSDFYQKALPRDG